MPIKGLSRHSSTSSLADKSSPSLHLDLTLAFAAQRLEESANIPTPAPFPQSSQIGKYWQYFFALLGIFKLYDRINMVFLLLKTFSFRYKADKEIFYIQIFETMDYNIYCFNFGICSEIEMNRLGVKNSS